MFVCCCCCFFGGRGLGVISKEPLFSVFSTIYLSLQKVQGLLTCEAARLHIISRNLAAAAPHQRDIFTSVCIILLCPNSGCQCFRIFCREHRLVLMYVLMYVIATRGWEGGGGGGGCVNMVVRVCTELKVDSGLRLNAAIPCRTGELKSSRWSCVKVTVATLPASLWKEGCRKPVLGVRVAPRWAPRRP